MKESYDYLLNFGFKDNDYIVVGISGGPDSMTLLHLLILIREKIRINIVCAHVNHNVRKESKDEEVFVKKYCENNNVIFEYMKIESFSDKNFNENIARNIRYDFFKSLVKKYNAKALLTAHHGDDLMETILMRLTRGSTLKGYAGFSKEIDMGEYKLLRPLIFYTKEDIIKYNKLNNISYVTDLSNDNLEYTRNRYRHNVLPFFKKEDINVHNKFLKFSEVLIEYSDYIDKISLSNIDKIYMDNKLDINEYNKLDKLIAKRVINHILEMIYNDALTLITDTHVELIMNLISSNKPNAKLLLPNNILVVKEYNYLVFKEAIDESYEYKILLNSDTILPNGKKIVFVKNEDSDSNFVCRLNSSDITLPLYVRNKCDGDKISVKGLNGSKKIKDIFIDEKVSLNDRRKWPIVVDANNNVLWLPGLKKSKYNKKLSEKYDIIIKYD